MRERVYVDIYLFSLTFCLLTYTSVAFHLQWGRKRRDIHVMEGPLN